MVDRLELSNCLLYQTQRSHCVPLIEQPKSLTYSNHATHGVNWFIPWLEILVIQACERSNLRYFECDRLWRIVGGMD
jgi:hypothetical protein